MAFLATSGQNEYLTMSPYIGNKAGFQEWRYVTTDALATIIAASYITDAAIIRKFRVGDTIRVYQCTDRDDVSTQTATFAIKVTAKTTTTITLAQETYGGIPAIAVGAPEDMLVVNDAGTAFEFLPAYPKRLHNLEYFGGIANGVFQNDDVVNEMIGSLIAGDRHMLEFPPDITLLSDAFAPTELTGGATSEYMTIRGMEGGYASRIQFEAGSGTASCLFKIGSASEFALSLGVSNLHVEFLNTPGTSEALFHCARYSELDIQNIQGNGVCRLFYGATGGRTTLRNWKIVPSTNCGATDSIIYLEDVASQYLQDIVYGHAALTANTDANGKIIHLKIGSGASVDTVLIRDCKFQLYNNGVGTADEGRPYGVYMEMTASETGSMSNCSILDNYIDHTSVAGIYLDRVALNNSYGSKNVIRGNHTLTSGGRGIWVANSSTTGTKRINAMDISHNNVVVKDDSPGIDVAAGDGVSYGINVADNIVTCGDFSGGAVTKDHAIRVGGTGVAVHDNVIDNQFNTTPGFVHGIKITPASSKDIRVHDNFMPRIKREVTYASSTAPFGTYFNIHRHVETSWDKHYTDPKWYTRKFDFDGLTIPSEFTSYQGSDASATPPAITSAGAAGFITMPLGVNAGATMALNGNQLHLANRMMFASAGGMFIESRLKTTVASSVVMFCGFSDQNSVLEMPFTISGATLTSNASDAVGLLMDTNATASTWKGVGVKADTDSPTGIQDSGVAISTAFLTLRVEVYEDETAVMYVNGVPVSSTDLASAITKSTSVVPYIAAYNLNTSAKSILIDKLNFGCQRAVF